MEETRVKQINDIIENYKEAADQYMEDLITREEVDAVFEEVKRKLKEMKITEKEAEIAMKKIRNYAHEVIESFKKRYGLKSSDINWWLKNHGEL